MFGMSRMTPVGLRRYQIAPGDAGFTPAAGSLFYETSPLSNLTQSGGFASQLAGVSGFPLVQATGANQPAWDGTKLTFDGVNDVLVSTQPTSTFGTAINMPDASGGDPTKGFTCTGLVRDPTDGTWWAGNDGRNVIGDVTYLPSLVKLSADFTTKTGEILLNPLFPAMQTCQGVAYDTSDNTLWFASTDESFVRHVSKAGADLGSISPGYKPNALAYDAALDALIVGRDVSEASNKIVEWRNASTGALIKSITLQSNPDQFCLAGQYLWYTVDPGNLNRFDLFANIESGGYTLANADFIEGCAIEGNNVYILNDGYFHGSATPLNRALTYTITQFPNALGSRYVLAGVNRLVAAPSAASAVMAGVGDCINLTGTGIVIPNGTSTILRVFVKPIFNIAAATVDFTGLPLTTKFLYAADVNLVAKTVTMRINGVQIGAPVDITAALAGAVNVPMGYGSNGKVSSGASTVAVTDRFVNLEMNAVAALAGAQNIPSIERYLAGRYGVTLP